MGHPRASLTLELLTRTKLLRSWPPGSLGPSGEAGRRIFARAGRWAACCEFCGAKCDIGSFPQEAFSQPSGKCMAAGRSVAAGRQARYCRLVSVSSFFLPDRTSVAPSLAGRFRAKIMFSLKGLSQLSRPLIEAQAAPDPARAAICSSAAALLIFGRFPGCFPNTGGLSQVVGATVLC